MVSAPAEGVCVCFACYDYYSGRETYKGYAGERHILMIFGRYRCTEVRYAVPILNFSIRRRD